MNTNAYKQYKEQSIMTMTKGELLIVLFDELTKRLMRAELSMKHGNFEIFEESTQRCVEIVKYLKDTLNYDYEISRELGNMYDFFLYELARLQAGRRPEIVAEILPLVKELREAFDTASKTA